MTAARSVQELTCPRRLERDLAAMTERNTELARRVTSLETERDALVTRVHAIADEQCGMAVRTVDESLTAIEQREFSLRQRVSELERGLHEACDGWDLECDEMHDLRPQINRLRKLAYGPTAT